METQKGGGVTQIRATLVTTLSVSVITVHTTM